MNANTRPARHYRWAALAMADTPRIETRLRAILNSSTRPLGVRSRRLQTGVTLLCGAALVGGLAVLRPAVRAAEPIAVAAPKPQLLDIGWVYRPAPGSDTVRLPDGVTVQFKGIQRVRPNEKITSYGRDADGIRYANRKVLPSTPLGAGWNLNGVRTNLDAWFTYDPGVQGLGPTKHNDRYYRAFVHVTPENLPGYAVLSDGDSICCAMEWFHGFLDDIDDGRGRSEISICVGRSTGGWKDTATFLWPLTTRQSNGTARDTEWQSDTGSESIRLLAADVDQSNSGYQHQSTNPAERTTALPLRVALSTKRPFYGNIRAFAVDHQGVRRQVPVVSDGCNGPQRLLTAARGRQDSIHFLEVEMTEAETRTTKEIVLQSEPIECVVFDHVPLQPKSAAN